MTTQYINVKVSAKEQLTEDIVALTLIAEEGGNLPQWQPGAHIELVLEQYSDATGSYDEEVMLRQYSLCSDPQDCSQWQIAVLREDQGRGGSLFIHQQINQGDLIKVSEPRNHFSFNPAKRCLFIAGGIGITPMLPMVQQAEKEGIEWQLVYLSRKYNRMSFLDRLDVYDDEKVYLHSNDRSGMFDLEQLLAGCDNETSVYSCGPQPLLDTLEDFHAKQSDWSLHIERFSGGDVDTSGDAFDVVVSSTGQRIRVEEGQSILTALREAGVKIPSSCGDGVCGSCETAVLSGTPDHRDSILSEEEKADNDYMMLCVSRSLSPELILDL